MTCTATSTTRRCGTRTTGSPRLEIAELIELPAEYRNEAHTTGYYGHLADNVKAVYQRYLSWYDGNPANLWKLPPTDVGERYVALAGGPDVPLAHAARALRRAATTAGWSSW